MKIKRKKPKIKKVLSTCGWCDKKIGHDERVFGLGARKQPGVDLSKYEGGIIPVTITSIGKTVWAIVPTPESDARKEGKDFLFTACSDECAGKLKDALEEEKKIGDIFYG
ncbi:MAG: hypothetical protein OEV42_10065 [Deltaproteobacteria bacterium]|nr:hypothetical protein [Deltaproteobacteria bacterium]